MTESFDGEIPKEVSDRLNGFGQLTPHMQFFRGGREARVVIDEGPDGFNAYLGYVEVGMKAPVRRFSAPTKEDVVNEVIGVVFKPERRGKPFAIGNLLGGNPPPNRV